MGIELTSLRNWFKQFAKQTNETVLINFDRKLYVTVNNGNVGRNFVFRL
jgi:hypothetical protein